MTAYLDGYSGYSGVPEDAAAEILEKLMTHQQISSDEVARILKRYGVCGEPEALQIAYRKKVGQRLIASLRDPYGRREVFSTGNTYTRLYSREKLFVMQHGKVINQPKKGKSTHER